jgi:hypothetical protein
MAPKYKNDAAFSHLLDNMLNGADHMAELEQELVNDRDEHLLALQRRFALTPAMGFRPGQIVQWKTGMKNRVCPLYEEPAIVIEVLNPPAIDTNKELDGTNLYREPLNLVLGVQDVDGDFYTWHFDGRRFEVVHDVEAIK